MRTCSCNRPNIGLNVTYRSKVNKNRKRRRQYDKRLPSILVERLIKLLFVVGIHFLFQIHSYMHVYHCSCSICLIICHFSLKGFWTSKCNVPPTKSHNSLKWLCIFFMQLLFRKMIFFFLPTRNEKFLTLKVTTFSSQVSNSKHEKKTLLWSFRLVLF